jgi:hypothetical protein
MSSERNPPGGLASAEIVAVLVPNATHARAWIPVLAETLVDRLGVATYLVTTGSAKKSQTMTAPEHLERCIFTSSRDFGRMIDVTTFALESLSPRPTIIIDVTGQLDPSAAYVPVLSPVLNGHMPEVSIVSALWSRQPPQLGVRLAKGQGSEMLHAAFIAIPDREMTRCALDVIFRRLVALLLEAMAHLLRGKPLPALPTEISEVPAPLAGGDMWKQTIHGYLPKAGRQFVKRFIRRGDWCIGYRHRTEPARIPEKLDLRPEAFTLLPSPPSCFYADPFLFEEDGDIFLFFEDYDYATGRAHISYVTLGPNGPSEPAVALVRPYHLSYPFVFAHDGRILMIPETSGNRSVELYEATAFPSAWRLYAVLIPNINASDVTVCQWDGRWWMFAAVVDHDSSGWDAVSVFWADMLEGPWHPHPMNPVKNDVTSARPAGALIQADGRLLRPAQDCSNGYGSALTWCEVVELTETGFTERVIARQTCPVGSGYYGLHTYNRITSFETVDFKRSRRRWPKASR